MTFLRKPPTPDAGITSNVLIILHQSAFDRLILDDDISCLKLLWGRRKKSTAGPAGFKSIKTLTAELCTIGKAGLSTLAIQPSSARRWHNRQA